MTSTPFHQFIDLVNFDQAIVALRKRQVSLEKSIAALEALLHAEQEKLEDAQKSYHALLKQRDLLDLDLASLSNDKESKVKRIERVQSPKEYMSLQTEIKLLEDRLAQSESQMVQTWEAIEAGEDAQTASIQEHAERSQELATQKSSEQNELGVVKKELENLLAARESKLVGIPLEWIEKYDAMSERLANPVVPVQGITCSGCSYQVPAPVLAQLNRHVLATCPNCYRMLYATHKDHKDA